MRVFGDDLETPALANGWGHGDLCWKDMGQLLGNTFPEKDYHGLERTGLGQLWGPGWQALMIKLLGEPPLGV